MSDLIMHFLIQYSILCIVSFLFLTQHNMLNYSLFSFSIGHIHNLCSSGTQNKAYQLKLGFPTLASY